MAFNAGIDLDVVDNPDLAGEGREDAGKEARERILQRQRFPGRAVLVAMPSAQPASSSDGRTPMVPET